MSSNNGGVQRTVLIVGAPQELGEQMAAAFIPDGYTRGHLTKRTIKHANAMTCQVEP